VLTLNPRDMEDLNSPHMSTLVFLKNYYNCRSELPWNQKFGSTGEIICVCW